MGIEVNLAPTNLQNYYANGKYTKWIMKARIFLLMVIVLTLLVTNCQFQNLPQETVTISTPTIALSSPTASMVPRPSSTSYPSPSPTFYASPTSVPTLTPLPTFTIAPTPISLPTSVMLPQTAPFIFLYTNSYLARTDEDGSAIQPITSLIEPAGEQVWLTFAALPPQVSPDGQWLIIYNGRGRWQLLNLTRWEVRNTGQGQLRLSPTWAPDSQSFAYLANNQLCIYKLDTGTDACLFTGENLLGASWSPNNLYIAVAQGDFTSACCVGKIWLIHVADNTAKMIGTYSTFPEATTNQIIEWVANNESLLIKGYTPFLYSPSDEATIQFQEAVVDISPNGQSILYNSGHIGFIDGTIDYQMPLNPDCPGFKIGIHNWDWSPTGDRLAYLSSCSLELSITNWLYVLDSQTGKIVWQKEISEINSQFPLEFLYWSPDGEYLFLDEPDEIYGSHALSPIWRIKSDSTSTIEPIVEEGFLLGIVPQWGE